MRQYLFLFFLLCLVWPLAVNAQQRDTLYFANGKLVWQDATTEAGRAYVEVDGEVFLGKLSSIKPDSIQQVTFLKPADAKTLYGVKGLNGAYLINTKKNAVAANQPPTDLPLADNKAIFTHSPTPSNEELRDGALYVVDGEMSSKQKVNNLNPKDIFSINILKKGPTSDPSMIQVENDVMIVVTTAGAIKSYQNTFAKFSKEYKTYLEAHKNDDSGIVYKFKNGSFRVKSKKQIDLLYQLKTETIDKVIFLAAHKKTSMSLPPTLLITTIK